MATGCQGGSQAQKLRHVGPGRLISRVCVRRQPQLSARGPSKQSKLLIITGVLFVLI